VEIKNDFLGLSMKIPQLCNEPNQFCRMFRADQALKIAGHRRNKPIATSSRKCRRSPCLSHHGCVAVEGAAERKFYWGCVSYYLRRN
jgi:hypothetical protein